jgi:putative tryptophan/tyrosine transport system substrate-binding protein
VRRIVFLHSLAENDPEVQGRIAAFRQGLEALGWTEKRNVQIEHRFSRGDIARIQAYTAELVSSAPDLIIATSSPVTAALKQATHTVPIVFSVVNDPVGQGFVASLAHPGGNITGISDVASTLTTKRLALLKEVSPRLRRVAMLWNKDDRGMTLRYDASAQVAQSIGITIQALGVRAPDDFNEAFTAMDKEPPDAILMVSDSLTTLNRKRVFDFAAQRRLPAIYEYDFLVRDGGLMSYGADLTESFERAGALVGRIFRGANPAELPFEQPIRYPFVVNLKTAKAMGLELPPNLVALADEVIE